MYPVLCVALYTGFLNDPPTEYQHILNNFIVGIYNNSIGINLIGRFLKTLQEQSKMKIFLRKYWHSKSGPFGSSLYTILFAIYNLQSTPLSVLNVIQIESELDKKKTLLNNLSI